MSVRIKALYLHQAITIPGTTVLGTATIIPEKNPNVVMTWEGDHILISERSIESMVPHANVAHALKMKEELKAPKK